MCSKRCGCDWGPLETLRGHGDVTDPVEAIGRLGEEVGASRFPPVMAVLLYQVRLLERRDGIAAIGGNDHPLPVNKSNQKRVVMGGPQ